uniref:Monoglyceride lipase-like n=1 Tax=Phallusia mammillata TaxID=59560 RepID=A0A6F9DKT9_9ASCI|nr:monoglyceride lipase-like [Phallusia mammillata]
METDNNRKTFSGKLFKDVDHFVNDDGQYLFYKTWKPENPVEFLLCVVHGFGGHVVRFDELSSHVNSIGGLAFGNDHVGHGESEGSRTTTHDYNVIIRDFIQLTEKMKKEYPDVPVFIYGQSMGGALSVLAACDKPELFKGIITVGGMFVKDPALQSPIKKVLLQFASAIVPNLQVTNLTDNKSTRDEVEKEKSLSDPLKNSVVKCQMAYQLLRIMEKIEEIMPTLKIPFLAMHGDADTTCSLEGSKNLHKVAQSEDKTLKIYKDCCHDLIHEIQPDRDQCFEDIRLWLKEHI